MHPSSSCLALLLAASPSVASAAEGWMTPEPPGATSWAVGASSHAAATTATMADRLGGMFGVGVHAHARLGRLVVGGFWDRGVDLAWVLTGERHQFLALGVGGAWLGGAGERHLLLVAGAHRVKLDGVFGSSHELPFLGLRGALHTRLRSGLVASVALAVLQDLRRELEASGLERVGGTTVLATGGFGFGGG